MSFPTRCQIVTCIAKNNCVCDKLWTTEKSCLPHVGRYILLWQKWFLAEWNFTPFQNLSNSVVSVCDDIKKCGICCHQFSRFIFYGNVCQMNMGVLVHSDRAMGQGSEREIPIPKKKWIKDYFTFNLGKRRANVLTCFYGFRQGSMSAVEACIYLEFYRFYFWFQIQISFLSFHTTLVTLVSIIIHNA